MIPTLLATGTTCLGFVVFIADPVPLLRDFASLAIAGILGELLWSFVVFYPHIFLYEANKDFKSIFKRIPIPSNPTILILISIVIIAMIPGIMKLKSDIYSLSVLPTSNKASRDHHFIEENIGNYFPLEYVVDIRKVASENVADWISSVFELEEIDGSLSYLSFSRFADPQDYGYISRTDSNFAR
ncbi:MAG: hypothetical protein IIB41_03240, partial [Candidatus Marinimicrobia bacterium]|nr:hypothetical protein [Candidatus Neomarinimicrobiota bacterium]